MEKRRSYSRITAILFDLDNTLIATRKADNLACAKMSEILQEVYAVPTDSAIRICNSFLKTFRKCPEKPSMDLDVWRHFLWVQALGDLHKNYSRSVYQQWLHLRYHYLQLMPEVKILLNKLREQYLIGLITNGPSTSQWEKINRLNLESLFDIILVSGDLPWEKPSHEIFHKACHYLGVEPRRCIMVGDKLETDILGAINAELGGSIWIPLNNDDEVEGNDPNPDFVLENVTELPGLLPKKNSYPKFRGAGRGPILSRLSLPELDDCNSNSSDGS